MTEISKATGDDKEKPDWWLANENLKDAFDLPDYEPPHFSDGTYVHEVVDSLEQCYGCEIRFVGVNPRYPDDWEVRIDREPVMSIGRRRTENGNTRYLMDPETFRETIRTELER